MLAYGCQLTLLERHINKKLNPLWFLADVSIAAVLASSGCSPETSGDNSMDATPDDAGAAAAQDAPGVVDSSIGHPVDASADASGNPSPDAAKVDLDATSIAPDAAAPGQDAGAGLDVAAGLDAASSFDAGPPTFGSACSGVATVLQGFAFAPNGADHLPSVRVYVPVQVKPYPIRRRTPELGRVAGIQFPHPDSFPK
jgi:hypothetical protein